MDELRQRKRVLRRLGYCTDTDVIEMKGRVACELSCADELLMTEMIFNGMFNTLTVEQSVSLLSCFVCDEKSSEIPKSTEELSGPLRQMQVVTIFILFQNFFIINLQKLIDRFCLKGTGKKNFQGVN